MIARRMRDEFDEAISNGLDEGAAFECALEVLEHAHVDSSPDHMLGTLMQGSCHRAYLRERPGHTPLVVIETEDDESWFSGMSFDIAWLPAFLGVIQRVHDTEEAQAALADIRERVANGTYYK